MRLRRPVDVHTSLSIYNIKYRDYKKNTFIGYLYIYLYTRLRILYVTLPTCTSRRNSCLFMFIAGEKDKHYGAG